MSKKRCIARMGRQKQSLKEPVRPGAPWGGLYGLLCISLILLLAGGALEASADGERKEITFSFWGGYKDLELFKEVSERFEAMHPDVKMMLQYVPNDYGEKLPLQLISNSAADILLMDDETYPGYAARGYLEDLQPYIDRDRDKVPVDGFWPTALKAFNYKGFVGGLAWGGFPTVIFYNKDMFDEAGIPYPTEDWTWADFRRIAKALTKDLDGDGRFDQYGTQLGFGFLDVEPVLWSFGGNVLTPDYTQSAINSPETLETFRFLQDMKFKDRSSILLSEQQGSSREVQILTDRLGMSASGWYVAQVLTDVKTDVRWGVAHMPKGPRGDRYTRVSWDGIALNARMQDVERPDLSEEERAEIQWKKETGWAFIKYLLSDEVQALICKYGRAMPITREYAEKYFVDPNSEVDEHLAIDAMGYGRLTPITPKYLSLRAVFDNTSAALQREKESARITPEEAMARMDEGFQEVLAAELADFGTKKEKIAAKSSTVYKIVALIAAAILAAFLVRLGRKTSTGGHDLTAMIRSRKRRIEGLWGLLFASPWMLGFSLFLAFPIVFSLVLSFSAWDPYDPVTSRTFIGMDNYVRALTQDDLMWLSLKKTFLYALIAVPIQLCCSLGLAMLLNQKVRGIRLFRTLFYLPNVVGGVATALMWMYIFNPIYGPLNSVLRMFNWLLDQIPVLSYINLPEPQWINDPDWALPALFLMMLWATGGGAMIIFLAGLQGVPKHLYEAADLDGAGRWRKFWNVTLPMLSPTIFFNLIMSMVGALQIFMQAFVMVGRYGGEQNQLLFYVLYLYRKAFLDYEFGYAAALAWILFAIILGFTLLIVRSSAMWVYYEGEKR